MCLQVVIAALCYNTPLLLETMKTLEISNIQGSLLQQFLKQWVHDVDCFLGLHDRKVAALGLCYLLGMTQDVRPQEVHDISSQIVPSLLVLFQGLKRAYESRAENENSDSDDDDDDDEDEDADGVPDALASDEDEIDEEGQQYLEKLEKSANRGSDDDSDSDSLDDDAEETALESYQTPLDDDNSPIDEYIIFKHVFSNLQTTDPNWYTSVTGQLTPEQSKQLEEIFKLADQRKAAAESKQIEKRGGYTFDVTTVPSNFNFS